MEKPTFKNFEDLTNKQFSKLKVKYHVGVINGHRRWICVCECSNEKIVIGSYLKSGRIRSCGCGVVEARYSHRMTNTPEYITWTSIKERCYYKKYKQYSDYGGRGIKVCDTWLESFENFYKDMGDKPSSEYSIDRINVNGDYCPENCRWATKVEQRNNTRKSIILTFNNKTQSLKLWSIELSMSYSALQSRLIRGWSTEKTLTTPIRNIKYRGNKNE